MSDFRFAAAINGVCGGCRNAVAWRDLERTLRRGEEGKCALCWQPSRGRTVRCCMCGTEAHVACAYPAVKAKRSPLFANHTCDECVEYELEMGYDEKTGARMKAAGKLASLAGLAKTAMELEALAVAGGTLARTRRAWRR